MKRFVVDTNVPIVANNRPDKSGKRASSKCAEDAIKFLSELLQNHQLLLDVAGEIQAEYHKHLNPHGQPGVGDRFYLAVLQSSPQRVQRIALSKRADGSFADLPDEIVESRFDQNDQKFAVLAKIAATPVVNATDSDWLEHRTLLASHGIHIRFLCGCERDNWFVM